MTAPLFVVALTGGIGAGKTTVANLFSKHGVPIIDADVIARELTELGQPAFMDIVDHFEEKILRSDGTLDRAKLRDVIFAHSEARKWLEALLHPLIRTEIERQMARITAPYCIVVIPLLFEVQPYAFIKRFLVVDASEETQIKRVTDRDKTSMTKAQAILKTQIDRAERKALAHDVIHNDGTLADLEPQVEKLHQMYLEMSRKPF
jgi:dephospho-CoA kinase